MAPRFGTDGIRGVANLELTPELALALGRAAARHLPGEGFVVGRDPRRSSPMLSAALAAGLAAEGRDVRDVGVVPTPAVAYLAARRGLPGAVVSASHNAWTDNGIKFFSPAGSKIPEETERAIEAELDAALSPAGAAAPLRQGATSRDAAGPLPRVGSLEADACGIEEYVDHLVAVIPEGSVAGRSVVLDCANGAASTVAPEVFARLGVRVVALHASPDGTNVNAGCGATDTSSLVAAMARLKADVGLAFDGDADRLVAVDERGVVLDGDQLLALFATDLAQRGELAGGGVVATVMSNLGLRRSLEAQGIEVVVTPVGDRYVADALRERGFVLGGEQSGHLVFSRHATTGDGILTGVLLLELVARRGESLSALSRGALERLPQELRSVAVPDPSRLAEAAALWEEAARIEEGFAGAGRVLVRASGTERVVRVMVEAPSPAAAVEAVERLVEVVRRELGSPGA